MENNNKFKKFLDNFKREEPEKLDRINETLNSVRDSIVGLKEVSVSPINETAKNTESISKNIERIQEIDSEQNEALSLIQQENANLNDTLKNHLSRIDNINNENITESNKELEKNTKLLIQSSQRQEKHLTEQTDLLKIIKDELKPKIPIGLEEQRAEKPDILKPNDDESSNQTPSLIPNITTSKKRPKKPSKLSKFGGMLGKLAVPVATIAASVSAFDSIKSYVNLEEVKLSKLEEIERLVAEGKISEADSVELVKKLDEEFEKNEKRIVGDIGSTGGMLAGGLGGMKIGATLGSIAGPIGGAIGAIGGGIIGSIGGSDLGRKFGETAHDVLNAEDVGKELEIKKDQFVNKVSDFYDDARDFIKTDIIDKGSEKIDSLINNIKERFNDTSETIKEKLNQNSVLRIEENRNPMIKVEGNTPSKFIEKTLESNKEIRDNQTSVIQPSSQIISNNNTTHNIIKPTPRENSESALDNYVKKISSFF